MLFIHRELALYDFYAPIQFYIILCNKNMLTQINSLIIIIIIFIYIISYEEELNLYKPYKWLCMYTHKLIVYALIAN